jgi:hypothetical protein
VGTTLDGSIASYVMQCWICKKKLKKRGKIKKFALPGIDISFLLDNFHIEAFLYGDFTNKSKLYYRKLKTIRKQKLKQYRGKREKTQFNNTVS